MVWSNSLIFVVYRDEAKGMGLQKRAIWCNWAGLGFMEKVEKDS